MQRTNIYLTVEQCRRLDARAQAEGTSRAELVRHLVDRGLAEVADDLDRDLAAIDASFGVVPGLADPSRGDDARARYLSELWMQPR